MMILRCVDFRSQDFSSQWVPEQPEEDRVQSRSFQENTTITRKNPETTHRNQEITRNVPILGCSKQAHCSSEFCDDARASQIHRDDACVFLRSSVIGFVDLCNGKIPSTPCMACKNIYIYNGYSDLD